MDVEKVLENKNLELMYKIISHVVLETVTEIDTLLQIKSPEHLNAMFMMIIKINLKIFHGSFFEHYDGKELDAETAFKQIMAELVDNVLKDDPANGI